MQESDCERCGECGDSGGGEKEFARATERRSNGRGHNALNAAFQVAASHRGGEIVAVLDMAEFVGDQGVELVQDSSAR